MRAIGALLIAILLCVSACASADHVKSVPANVDLDTRKVVRIIGPIDQISALRFVLALNLVDDLPGDLVIIINSTGGVESAGAAMISALEDQRAKGVRVVCVAQEKAHSMAFNLLTHCDVRLATARTIMIAHKIAVVFIPGRMTAVNLRKEAVFLDNLDEKYRRANSKALNMSVKEYDVFADADHPWTVKELLARKYLHGVATITK